MAQRLTRAKLTIKSAGAAFPELTPADRAARLPVGLKVLSLIFSEVYTASGGDQLYRVDLSAEAIRVARLLAAARRNSPDHRDTHHGAAVLLRSGWRPALAQSAIAGVVRDSSGAVLPGVTVEASSPALIEKMKSGVTNEEGQYRIVDLRPGTYSISFTLSQTGALALIGDIS